jgi:hypothetical protein
VPAVRGGLLPNGAGGLRGQVDWGDLGGLAAVGLAAAVLYVAGLRWWPGVVLGNLIATDSTLPNVTIIGQTLGNLAEVVVIAILLRRLLGDGATVDRLDRVPQMLLAIAVGTAVSALVGNPSLFGRRRDRVACGADYVQDVVAGRLVRSAGSVAANPGVGEAPRSGLSPIMGGGGADLCGAGA